MAVPGSVASAGRRNATTAAKRLAREALLADLDRVITSGNLEMVKAQVRTVVSGGVPRSTVRTHLTPVKRRLLEEFFWL